jgi:phosphatidylserine synthase
MAAWCMSRGQPAQALGGLALFCLSAVLDHSDGELARATSTESALGHVLDNISDGLVGLAVVAGMSWTIAQHLSPDHLDVIGWTIVAGLPLCFVVEWRLESLRAAAPRRDPTQPILFRIMNTLTSREPLYVFLLVYLMVTTVEDGRAWSALAWVFAGGIHLFWIGLGALGWRFFGLPAMLHGR